MHPKNDEPTSSHYTNAITDSYNAEARALDVVTVNNLVPARYGKIELSYYTEGPANGNIKEAKYYSNGVYQETEIQTREDSAGLAHKTTLNFINKTAQSLAGRCFVMYDNVGAVKVWFNVDFANEEPTFLEASRSIEVNLLSSHDSEAIVSRTSQKLNLDQQFITVPYMNYLIISSSSVGLKNNSYDINTGIIFKNTVGSEPETLNNTYFFINSALNQNQYCVLYSVDNEGVDPEIEGKTTLIVQLAKNATSVDVAMATKTVLDATDKFVTNINGDTLFVTNMLIGATDDASYETSGFLVFTKRSGEDRELLATLVMTYDLAGNIASVERL